MFTNNWWWQLRTNLAQTVARDKLINTAGQVRDSGYNNSNFLKNTGTFLYSNVSFDASTGIVLGSDDTPASMEDTTLKNRITAGLSCSVALSYDDEFNLIRTILCTNTSSDSITIREIGIYALAYLGAGSTSNMTCLMERTVLDTPVTIPAGGIGQVTYTIRMNYPTA